MNGMEWYFKYFLLYHFFFHYSQMFYDYILLIKKNMRLFSYSHTHTPRKLVLVVFYFFFLLLLFISTKNVVVVSRSVEEKRRRTGFARWPSSYLEIRVYCISTLSLSLSPHIRHTVFFFFVCLIEFVECLFVFVCVLEF